MEPTAVRDLHLIGVLAVANPVTGQSFTSTDFSLVGSLAEQAGLAVHNNEFLVTFQQCLAVLPESHRRVFTLREIDGMDGTEVCDVLSISPSNLYVMMHRARSGLRKCLDATWFQQPVGEDK